MEEYPVLCITAIAAGASKKINRTSAQQVGKLFLVDGVNGASGGSPLQRVLIADD